MTRYLLSCWHDECDTMKRRKLEPEDNLSVFQSGFDVDLHFSSFRGITWCARPSCTDDDHNCFIVEDDTMRQHGLRNTASEGELGAVKPCSIGTGPSFPLLGVISTPTVFTQSSRFVR